jgi:uncharacterized SAM-binding protein YcdF (DUF218 family)
MNDATITAAKTLWNYMCLGQPPREADCLLLIGSLRDDVALYAADLLNRYRYATVIISGGSSRLDRTRQLGWGEDSEAEHYLKVMREAGVTRQDILLETTAANTGQNACGTAALLARHSVSPRTIIIVTKPYMERRVKATFDVQWPTPRPKFLVASPPLRFEEYCTSVSERTHTINIMVGDLQRIIEYPKLGYQSEQAVPDEVRAAMQQLIEAGYTQHLLATQ